MLLLQNNNFSPFYITEDSNNSYNAIIFIAFFLLSNRDVSVEDQKELEQSCKMKTFTQQQFDE